jgi:hypothetical protein
MRLSDTEYDFRLRYLDHKVILQLDHMQRRRPSSANAVNWRALPDDEFYKLLRSLLPRKTPTVSVTPSSSLSVIEERILGLWDLRLHLWNVDSPEAFDLQGLVGHFADIQERLRYSREDWDALKRDRHLLNLLMRVLFDARIGKDPRVHGIPQEPTFNPEDQNIDMALVYPNNALERLFVYTRKIV